MNRSRVLGVSCSLGLVLGCFGLLFFTGCPAREAPQQQTAPSRPRVAVKLKVAVAGDAQLQKTIDRLRGEWTEFSGGEIETFDCQIEILADATANADLVIFPSRHLGELCEAGALRPVRKNILESEALRFNDFLPLVRREEIVYGRKVMALPIGCPAPLRLATAGEAEDPSILFPAGDDTQLALAYLAWSAPHVVHRGRVAALFDLASMRPRLTEPSFERALERFAQAAQAEGDQPRSRLVWPQRSSELEESGQNLTVALLPGAEESFNALSGEWESLAGQSRTATLVGSSGMLVGVAAGTRNAAGAFRYAAWLVGPSNAKEISTASDRVANCRGSFARSADPWFGGIERDLSKQFAMIGAEALRSERFLMTPRLLGVDDYLQALDAAVRGRLDGSLDTPDALGQAAEAWDELTESHGRDAQLRAYRRSLGIEEYVASP